MPRNARTSRTLDGVGHSRMAWTLSSIIRNPGATNAMAQELDFFLEELALALFGVELPLPQHVQHTANVARVFLQRSAVDEDIIEEDESEVIQEGPQRLMIRCMKVAGALVRPNGSTRNS